MKRLPSKHAGRASAKPPTSPRYSDGVNIFESWSKAYPIISSAKRSIVIIDSFLAGEILSVAEVIAEAAGNRAVTHLEVRLFMADPERPYGAQRIREKETPSVPNANKRQKKGRSAVQRLKKALHEAVSAEDREAHVERFEQSVCEVSAHIASIRKVQVKFFTYPAMTTARFIVIDDTDFVVGWFPLLKGNPGHPCCHVRSKGNRSEHYGLVEKFREQVKIFQGISKLVPKAEVRRILKRRRPKPLKSNVHIDGSAVLYN